MIKVKAIYLALISLFFFVPAHALQVIGVGDEGSFLEIYQDGYHIRLENNQLSYRYHDGDCLIADNENNIYIESSCKKLTEELAKQIKKRYTTMQEQNKEALSAMLKMQAMLEPEENNIEIKKISTSKTNGFNTTIYSAGASKYWVSTELLSQIKKEIDYDALLQVYQHMLDAFSQTNNPLNIMDKQERIEAELMTKGYLMKQIDKDTINAMTKKMLPPEVLEAMAADMGEGSVVLEVTSVNNNKVNIKKHKPSGRKVTIEEYLETMFIESKS